VDVRGSLPSHNQPAPKEKAEGSDSTGTKSQEPAQVQPEQALAKTKVRKNQ
jgi:hypothetical protein